MESAATLELNFDLNFEDANNREQARTDRNLRFGAAANWAGDQAPGDRNRRSTTGAGDRADGQKLQQRIRPAMGISVSREREPVQEVSGDYFLRTPIASRGGTSWTTSIQPDEAPNFQHRIEFLSFLKLWSYLEQLISMILLFACLAIPRSRRERWISPSKRVNVYSQASTTP